MNTIVNAACMFFFNAFSFIEVEPQIKCMTDNGWVYSNVDNDYVDEYCVEGQSDCVINYDSPSTIDNLII